MEKIFKNKITGIVETVTNPEVIKQMEKYTDTYEEVKEAKKGSKKTETTPESNEE